jgi:hypothetical protein
LLICSTGGRYTRGDRLERLRGDSGGEHPAGLAASQIATHEEFTN